MRRPMPPSPWGPHSTLSCPTAFLLSPGRKLPASTPSPGPVLSLRCRRVGNVLSLFCSPRFLLPVVLGSACLLTSAVHRILNSVGLLSHLQHLHPISYGSRVPPHRPALAFWEPSVWVTRGFHKGHLLASCPCPRGLGQLPALGTHPALGPVLSTSVPAPFQGTDCRADRCTPLGIHETEWGLQG